MSSKEEIKELLDKLNPKRVDDYWNLRYILSALANSSKDYKDLAEYICKKSASFNKEKFEKQWKKALNPNPKGFSIKMNIDAIRFWVKHDNRQ